MWLGGWFIKRKKKHEDITLCGATDIPNISKQSGIKSLKRGWVSYVNKPERCGTGRKQNIQFENEHLDST